MSADPRLPTEVIEIEENVFEIPTTFSPGMRVPGIIFADREIVAAAAQDKAFKQVANVAHLPGIVRASFAMPDIHWGYGFPIGGVAATRVSDGVVSPGGVGFDISCGVRLIRTELEADDVVERMPEFIHELARSVPKGLGRKGNIHLGVAEIEEVLTFGAQWCVENGYGRPEDLAHIEEAGRYKSADSRQVSARAKERGLNQLGTLGSGNHFLEAQVVEEVYEKEAARILGLEKGRLTIMIHCGSRGVGHQVCTDSLREMTKRVNRERFDLPDKQLACAPVKSAAGQDYLGAMSAAANFALANRQAITHQVRAALRSQFGSSAGSGDLVYDVSHNMAKIETHEVGNKQLDLCVHRKGATRAFGPGHPGVPETYRRIGQPVLIPGDMGTCSYVLVGTDRSMIRAWGSTCHGAGRLLSRKAAAARMSGTRVAKEMAAKGIVVEAGHPRTLSEEASYAYKDVTRVVDVCQRAGLSKKVAKLRPLGVLKG